MAAASVGEILCATGESLRADIAALIGTQGSIGEKMPLYICRYEERLVIAAANIGNLLWTGDRIRSTRVVPVGDYFLRRAVVPQDLVRFVIANYQPARLVRCFGKMLAEHLEKVREKAFWGHRKVDNERLTLAVAQAKCLGVVEGLAAIAGRQFSPITRKYFDLYTSYVSEPVDDPRAFENARHLWMPFLGEVPGGLSRAVPADPRFSAESTAAAIARIVAQDAAAAKIAALERRIAELAASLEKLRAEESAAAE